MKIEPYLEAKRQEIDRFLAGLFSGRHDAERLAEAMRYSLLAGGKRIRPILTITASEAIGHSSESVLQLGCAIEMIHTYSLIHDDLPSMDNDDLRRGRPTNHKVYGDAMAILAGDALLTEAFSLIASIKADAGRLVAAVGEIARSAGLQGMAGGQALDIEAVGQRISPEEIERLHRMKTGCLIRSSVVAGAILAGASPDQVESIRRYGEAVGLCFQIADDILDVEGGVQMGKPVGGDARKSKPTYASVLGLGPAKELARQWSGKAIHALQGFDERADPLREIAHFIVNRKT